MNLETIIREKVHALPMVKQEKVLAFVEKLEHEEVISNDKPERTEEEKRQGRLALIGIARGRKDLSQTVDETLAEGANKCEGWSLP
ncbi:MAG: hypothetical protein H0X49_03970 [Acidobacteria bacterium]|jgi:hypothetical protein|nr:hypothetical protein [Acidobacteriota bacterium]MBA4183151.1 hypothetical protein [Acidobacteriota bacterium]